MLLTDGCCAQTAADSSKYLYQVWVAPVSMKSYPVSSQLTVIQTEGRLHYYYNICLTVKMHTASSSETVPAPQGSSMSTSQIFQGKQALSKGNSSSKAH